jgi:succinate dehydrogenase flavin-adding protein (antitoxin of CptAB toxin-antitoxin module)
MAALLFAGRAASAAAAFAAVRALPAARALATKAGAAAAAAASTTQPVQFTGSGMTPEVLTRIGERDGAMRAAYDAMPAAFPEHAQPDSSAPAIDAHAAFRKRLLYRSKQRGWCVGRRGGGGAGEGGGKGGPHATSDGRLTFLRPTPTPPTTPHPSRRLEVDLLMGAWAEAHLAGLPDGQLGEYERLLNRETIDLYNFVTARVPIPPEVDTPLLRAIQAFVQSSPLGRADPKAYEKVKGIYSN